MPVIQTYEPEHCQLVLSIKTRLLGGGSGQQSIDLLNQALEIIRNGSWEDDPKRTISSVPIDLGNVHKVGREFDPWQTDSVSAWTQLFRDQTLRPKLREWLKSVAETVREARDRRDGIQENNETQLGEVPAFLFAMEDKSFIEDLCRLQRLWDYEHLGERALEAGFELIAKHGICNETEPLVEAELHLNLEVMHCLITELLGDATKYPPFRKLVVEFNEAFKKAKPEQYQAILHRLATATAPPAAGRAEERRLESTRWPWPWEPEILADVDTILAELDAIALGKG